MREVPLNKEIKRQIKLVRTNPLKVQYLSLCTQ